MRRLSEYIGENYFDYLAGLYETPKRLFLVEVSWYGKRTHDLNRRAGGPQRYRFSVRSPRGVRLQYLRGPHGMSRSMDP